MGDIDLAALGVEADEAATALKEAAIGSGDPDLAAFGMSLGPAGGGGREGERALPVGGEDGVAGAGVVETHQAEAGGRGVLSAKAGAKAVEEEGLCLSADLPVPAVRLATHRASRT